MDDTFPLTVTVKADEWARINKRVRYLEAALIQAYRNQRQLKEWFSANELMAMALATLPATRQGLLRKAQAEEWLAREMYGRGGARFEFHFSSLPRKAFDDLIRRIIAAPPDEGAGEQPALPVAHASGARALPKNAAPPWVLPLMRLLRTDAHMAPEEACRLLTASLPPSVPPPTEEEVSAALHRLRAGRP